MLIRSQHISGNLMIVIPWNRIQIEHITGTGAVKSSGTSINTNITVINFGIQLVQYMCKHDQQVMCFVQLSLPFLLLSLAG
jgi:hypothetical protein